MRHLTEAEIAKIEPEAKKSGIPLDTCPTCGSELKLKEWGWDRIPGTFRLGGQDHACDCDSQILLRKHYLLAHIPYQYMKLDWELDFRGDGEVKKYVDLYLDRWSSAKTNGMGVEFGGTQLGIGKTFAATHIGKELIKRGEDVYFVSFREMLPMFKDDDKEKLTTHVLVLDEVQEPFYERQQAFFADAFEDLIRHRTNHNSITIMTTNLTSEAIRFNYPRVYSLLRAKQWRINIEGEDVRKDWVENENTELLINGEVKPIT